MDNDSSSQPSRISQKSLDPSLKATFDYRPYIKEQWFSIDPKKQKWRI